MAASESGNIETMRILHDVYNLDKKDAQAAELNGYTPLFLAAMECKADAMQLLHDVYRLDKTDAQVNVSPLSQSAIEGDIESLQILHDVYNLDEKDAQIALAELTTYNFTPETLEKLKELYNWIPSQI